MTAADKPQLDGLHRRTRQAGYHFDDMLSPIILDKSFFAVDARQIAPARSQSASHASFQTA